jgi:hypothetical protein
VKEKGIPVKEDLYTPLPLLKDRVFDSFVCCEAALNLGVQLLTRTTCPMQSKFDKRWRFPLVGTRGGPGTGKVTTTNLCN